MKISGGSVCLSWILFISTAHVLHILDSLNLFASSKDNNTLAQALLRRLVWVDIDCMQDQIVHLMGDRVCPPWRYASKIWGKTDQKKCIIKLNKPFF